MQPMKMKCCQVLVALNNSMNVYEVAVLLSLNIMQLKFTIQLAG